MKDVYITGDIHGTLPNVIVEKLLPEDSVIIILGDAGFLYYGQKSAREKNLKSLAQSLGYTFYCVRGNHERRPQSYGLELRYDNFVKGNVYWEDEYPNIKYFADFGEYRIEDYSIAVIGGAYSVDKTYRLQMGYYWNPEEQLNAEEQQNCYSMLNGKHYDFILSHTCPYSYRPIHLFLPSIDQSTVDNSMEEFLEKIKDSVDWDAYCFGHYHGDEILANGVKMFYEDIWHLDKTYDRLTETKE